MLASKHKEKYLKLSHLLSLSIINLQSGKWTNLSIIRLLLDLIHLADAADLQRCVSQIYGADVIEIIFSVV